MHLFQRRNFKICDIPADITVHWKSHFRLFLRNPRQYIKKLFSISSIVKIDFFGIKQYNPLMGYNQLMIFAGCCVLFLIASNHTSEAEHPCLSEISKKLLCNFIEIAFRRGCSYSVRIQENTDQK